MLKCVEGNNAHRVIELARHEIGDDGFEVCPLDFGFAVNDAKPAEAVDHEVGGMIRAVGHYHWRPTGARHTHLLRNTPTFKHQTGNCSCSKERPRRSRSEGPATLPGTSARQIVGFILPSQPRLCQSRPPGGTSRTLFWASARASARSASATASAFVAA